MSEYSYHMVVAYDKNGNNPRVVRKAMKPYENGLYIGKPKKSYQGESVEVFQLYDSKPVGIKIGTASLEWLSNWHSIPYDDMIADYKDKIEKVKWIGLGDILFLEHNEPELVPAATECREKCIARIQKSSDEQKAKRQAEHEQKIQQVTADFNHDVETAIRYVLDGGCLRNETVTYYDSKSDEFKEKCLVLVLMDKFKVNVPIKTRGWIKTSLVSVTYSYEGKKVDSYNIYKGKRGSSVIFDYFRQLQDAVWDYYDEDCMTEDEVNAFFGEG